MTTSWTVIFNDESTFHLCGVVNQHNFRIWGSGTPYTFCMYECDSPKLNVVCPFSPWGDRTLLLSRADRDEYILSGYASVICCSTGGTPLTKHFLSTRWCYSTLGPDRVSACNFSTLMGWINLLALHSPSITPLHFSLWGYVKDQVFSMNVGSIDKLNTWMQLLLWWFQMLENCGVKMTTIWIFCGLQMVTTLGCINAFWIVFQLTHTAFPYLFYFCVSGMFVMWWRLYGHYVRIYFTTYYVACQLKTVTAEFATERWKRL
jgi:hypothetical protein